MSYPYPPDRYAIARDTRVEQRERLRTLFSRILFNYGVVDRSLGGWCEIQYYQQSNVQDQKHDIVLLQPKHKQVSNEVVYVYARIRLSTPNLITTLFISMTSTI